MTSSIPDVSSLFRDETPQPTPDNPLDLPPVKPPTSQKYLLKQKNAARFKEAKFRQWLLEAENSLGPSGSVNSQLATGFAKYGGLDGVSGHGSETSRVLTTAIVDAREKLLTRLFGNVDEGKVSPGQVAVDKSSVFA